MLPATKAVPKELMPLVDTPVIEYIVDEAVQSGIEHVIIVTSAGKRAVEDHFGRVHELERLLETKGDAERLDKVRRTSQMVDIAFVRQHEMGGIADAVRVARRAVGNEPFVLILPDDVIAADPPATRQLLDVFDRVQSSVVCVEHVPAASISLYGVIQARPVEEGVYRVEGLVEKPPPEQAPSDLAIVGRYVFTPSIFEAIAEMQRPHSGELQITDAMSLLIGREALYAAEVRGKRYDTGQPFGFLQAGIELMLERPAYASRLRTYLSGLVQSDDFGNAAAADKKGQV
jgi:UTP--glucose-1-phosphate uridylyltransferase